ncbi:MAG: type II toxin-antitoxin system VapC family toxin [Carbonactinosporaceae bacterium]
MIVVDTGPLVALADAGDKDHARCTTWLDAASEPLVVPTVVLTEVCYLLEREGGARLEAAFLRAFRDSQFTLAPILPPDIDRMIELIEQYADLPLGGVDAAVVALAERYGATTMASLDRRHFSIVRPRHVSAFTLVPD